MLALILAVIVAVGAAMGGVVAVSDSAAPGDALYGIDRTVEKARVGLAGSPDEFFCHLRGYGESYQGWDFSDYEAYIRRVIEATATPNGVFGAKMMGGFVGDFVSRVRSSLSFTAPLLILIVTWLAWFMAFREFGSTTRRIVNTFMGELGSGSLTAYVDAATRTGICSGRQPAITPLAAMFQGVARRFPGGRIAISSSGA